MCRATNYVGLLRKGLADAGYPQVPVIALSTQGFESNPGLQITPALLHRAVKAFLLGDLMLKCLLRVRPYEVEKGSADRLYHQWDAIVRETIEHHGRSATAKRTTGKSFYSYSSLAKAIVTSFDTFPLQNIARKPRVGVVGEILVKFHPDANNHVIDVIESQGCEAVMPGITEFMVQNLYVSEWNKQNLGTGGNLKVKGLMKDVVDLYEKPIRNAIDLAHGKFTQDLPMDQLVEKARSVTSVGVQAGEGWLLTGEIMELIDSGTPNVVCAQPFACLPNHVTGRGMFQEIRRQRGEANIVSIDYDPGSSEANQLNRIKLMISAAKKAYAKAEEEAAREPASPQLEPAS
jgi:predicted nucleotide-binding protein (sugar kinase/HSP70/actin superfamily)